MEIILKKPEDLILYSNNPRLNDKAADAVANSIRDFGFKVPIVIDSNNVIVTGHTRLKASQKLGLETVPCIVADDLTPEQVKAFRLADNKVTEISEWDFEKLEAELLELDYDMSQFGFEDFSIDEKENVIDDEAEIPEPPKEAKSKVGDIYQLGRHRLMCGDSTSKDDIAKLINGERINLVLTDPPYGINVVKNSKVGGGGALHFGKVDGEGWVESSNYMPIKGDETTETAEKFYHACVELEIENYILFGGNYFTDFLKPKACWIVWDKENTGNFADVELAWTSFDKGAKLYKWLWNGLCRKGERAIEGKTRVHPTQKPVGLMGEILKDFSDKNDLILDCFGGSGSTLIACEQLKRTCYMMEYEPSYIDVIIERWEQLTGEKAIKING